MVTQNMSERIALIDMDGTVADYDAGIQAYYDDMTGPGEYGYYSMNGFHSKDLPIPDYLWKRIELIRNQPEWWRNLPPLPVGFEIISVLDEFHFEYHVATKGPSSNPQAWAEKVEWVRHWMPYADVHITEKKSLLYGKVLVDDYPPYTQSWLQWRPNGLVVMPAHHYNKEVNDPQILRYEEGMQDQLRERLEKLLRV